MKISCLCLCALLCLAAVPTLAGPPFDVDDPGTPERHHYELNLSVQSSQVKGSETQRLPHFDLGYGYQNNIQFGVEFGGTSVRNAGTGRMAGFDDISLNTKWRFLEETKSRPQLSFGYALKIPTASRSRGLGTGNFDHSLTLAAQKSLGRHTLTANLGYVLLGDAGSRDNLTYGLLYTYQLTEHLVVGGDIYGNTSAAVGQRDEFGWGIGLTYNYAPDRSLLLKAGRSEHGMSDLNVYAGVQFEFK